MMPGPSSVPVPGAARQQAPKLFISKMRFHLRTPNMSRSPVNDELRDFTRRSRRQRSENRVLRKEYISDYSKFTDGFGIPGPCPRDTQAGQIRRHLGDLRQHGPPTYSAVTD